MVIGLGSRTSLPLLLSLVLLSAPAFAGSPPLHPAVDFHDDHGDSGGGNTSGAAPPAQGATTCVGGFAGSYPCRNVDLLSFLPLDKMGGQSDTRGSDLWGWTDPQTRREYALMVLSHGASFVDVTDPTRPRWLGFLPSQTGRASGNRDVRVYRDYAYIVADAVGAHGMQVFDLKRLRKAGPPKTFTADHVYTQVENVHNIDIDVETGFAYLVGSNTCNGGLHMVDLREDPLHPKFAGCFANAETGGAIAYVHDTQCVIYRGPDSRFAGRELCFASNVNALTIFDVTDKSAVRVVARQGYTGSAYCHQGWLTEDHRHFLMDDEGDEVTKVHNTRTYLWDVTDLTNPRQFAQYDHATRATDHDQYIHQGFAYQGNYSAGLRILDVARVAEGTLEEVGYFDIVPESDDPTVGGAWGAFPFFKSGIVLIAGQQQGLYVVRRSDLAKPGEPCDPGAQTLCLGKKRFKLEVDWANQFDGSSGRARAIQVEGGSAGYFSFGDPTNLELMVKVLNDGSHWKLYYGQLTNLGFAIRVTDTETGQVRTYGNGTNNCGGIVELAASNVHGHSEAPVWLGADPAAIAYPGEGISGVSSLAAAMEVETGEALRCKPGILCLVGSQYSARVTWRNQFTGASGVAKPRQLSLASGSFSFTKPENVEVLLKLIRTEDSRTLVIWGSLTNLEYTLELSDRFSGKRGTYHNPAGTFCGGLEEF